MVLKRLMLGLAIAGLFTSTAYAKPVGVGTSAAGSFTYSIGSAVAKVAMEKAGIQMRVQPMGGGNVHLPATNAGQTEFSMSPDLEAYLAWKGENEVFQKSNPNLQLVCVLAPMRTAFFVKKDSPLQSIKELKGRRVSSGFTTQKIILRTMKAHLANAGLTYDDVITVPAPNVMRAAEDFAAGKTEILYFALGSAKIMQVSARVGGVRLLSLDPAPEAWERVNEISPTAYATRVEPSPALHGVMAPATVLAYDFVIVTNAGVPDDLIYNLTKALHGNKEMLGATFKPLNGFSQDKMAKKGKQLPYHSGAIKFYKEQGLWPPK